MVCRLVDQKGVDIALDVAQQLRGLEARLVLVGRGEPALEAAATHAAERNERVAYLPTSDEATAHLLMAGSDLLLVPSRFEPCGLTPMEAMRCGTIPVVSPVGGLRDTIIDASADGVLGNGFIAPAVDAVGMSLAVGSSGACARRSGPPRRDPTKRDDRRLVVAVAGRPRTSTSTPTCSRSARPPRWRLLPSTASPLPPARGSRAGALEGAPAS